MVPNKPNFTIPKDGADLNCASQIPATAIRWVLNDLLSLGTLHILAGEAGTGKTTIALDFAAILSNSDGTNKYWPDNNPAPSGSVVIWNGEDDMSDTLIPRLAATGANLQNIFFVSGTRKNGKCRAFDPAADLDLLTLSELSIIGDNHDSK